MGMDEPAIDMEMGMAGGMMDVDAVGADDAPLDVEVPMAAPMDIAVAGAAPLSWDDEELAAAPVEMATAAPALSWDDEEL
jgi:hypothetical protein